VIIYKEFLENISITTYIYGKCDLKLFTINPDYIEMWILSVGQITEAALTCSIFRAVKST
jgi:hypothetical protein